MASSSTSLSFSLLLLSLLAVSSAHSLTRAAAILSDSGFKSMSLALDLASHSLNSPSPSLTVFAPSDTAFAAAAGQPSLDLIRLHLSPVAFPLRSLKSLPFGAKIATLLDGSSLAVTNSQADRRVSLNNVTVTAAAIFDDGELIIFGIDRFFNRYFRISAPIGTHTDKILGCLAPRNPNEATAAFDPLGEASKVLRSSGCSVMALFLEMQFHVFLKYQTMLTVFAPVDHVMGNVIGDPSQYSSVLRRHVIPCRLSWSDLQSLEDGSPLRTNLEGFVINVSRYGSVLEFNQVSVIMPEMYQNNWLVVHGISKVLELPQSPTPSPIESPTEPNPVVKPVPSPPQSKADWLRSELINFGIWFVSWFVVGIVVGFVLELFGFEVIM